MSNQPLYTLFYTPSTLYLYTLSKGTIRCLLEEPLQDQKHLFSLLSTQGVRALTVVDATFSQEIVWERCPRFLSLKDCFVWYREKRRALRESRTYFLFTRNLQRREALSFSLAPATARDALLQKLQDGGIRLTMLSYGAEIGHSLQEDMLRHRPAEAPGAYHLLVGADAQGSVNFWLFHNGHGLVFWRLWEAATLAALSAEAPPLIEETMRYSEKMYGASLISLTIFWEPSHGAHTLEAAFPQASLFHGETFHAFLEKEGVHGGDRKSLFHSLVVARSKGKYILSSQHGGMRLRHLLPTVLFWAERAGWVAIIAMCWDLKNFSSVITMQHKEITALERTVRTLTNNIQRSSWRLEEAVHLEQWRHAHHQQRKSMASMLQGLEKILTAADHGMALTSLVWGATTATTVFRRSRPDGSGDKNWQKSVEEISSLQEYWEEFLPTFPATCSPKGDTQEAWRMTCPSPITVRATVTPQKQEAQ